MREVQEYKKKCRATAGASKFAVIVCNKGKENPEKIKWA